MQISVKKLSGSSCLSLEASLMPPNPLSQYPKIWHAARKKTLKKACPEKPYEPTQLLLIESKTRQGFTKPT